MRKIAILLALLALCAALTSCGMMIEILDSMLEHPHEYTYTLEPGEEEGAFDLVGRCPYEYCENPTDITKNVEVYISSTVEGDCINGGKIVYSHDFAGGTVSYTLVDASAGGHRLCGVPASKFYINGSMIDSSVPGVTIINEASATCGGTADAIYVCEACGELQEILALVSHKGTWTVKTTPTCTLGGREEINCERCSTRVERDIAAYGHNQEVTVVNNTDGTSNITYSCTVAGCTAKGLTLKGAVGFTEISRTEPTCTQAGSIVYTYTMNNSLSTLTISKRSLEHSLDGAPASTRFNSDGTIDYGNGVTVINQTQLVCGNIAGGYYFCDSCGTAVPSSVYVRPHHYEGSDKWTVVSPTCQQQGSVTKPCKYCSYKLTEQTGEESLDKYHNVGWTVTITGDDISTAVASGGCQNSGCSLVVAEGKIDKGSYSYTTKTATCKKAGEITHSWTVGGTPVQYKTTTLTVGHTIIDNDGKKIPAWTITDDNGYYDYALDAINLFAGGSISCGNTAAANYRCADCGEVSQVTAIQHHTMKEYSTVAAGCATSGYKLYKCSSCGVQDSEIIPASHTLEYVHDLDENTLTYKCVKNSSDCNYSETTLDLSAGNLAILRVISQSTCCDYGVAEYVFFYTPVGSSSSTSITFMGKLELGSHTIKDNSGKVVSAETLCDANGYYDSSLDAIKYFAGNSAPAVGMTGNGYYKCESCGDIAQVTVINTGKD